jgi:hypothetical protein
MFKYVKSINMNNLRLLAVIVFVGMISVMSCKKSDSTPPYVRLNGPADTIVILNIKFIDPKAFAKDDTDGEIDVSIINPPNTDSVGTYKVTYQATDAAGNQNSVFRMVHVVNQASVYQGNYKASQPCAGADSVFSIIYTPSNSQNNAFYINRVDKYKNVRLKIEIQSTSTLNIPFQRILVNTTDTVTITGGSGTIFTGGFDLNYQGVDFDSTGGHYYSCSGKYRK